MAREEAPLGVQSLEIGVQLFKYLHRAGKPITLTELATQANMHPSKVHRYLVSLIRTDLVESRERGLYQLGSYAMELSASGPARSAAFEIAERALDSLAARVNETVFLALWGIKGPRVAAVAEAPNRAVSLKPRLGHELPLWNFSSSRAFVAWLPVDEAEVLIEEELATNADGGLSADQRAHRRRKFMEELKLTRQHGLARTTGERYEGLVSFSAPVFNARGEVVMAVTAFGLAATLSPEWESQPARLLKEFAQYVTKQIHGSPPTVHR